MTSPGMKQRLRNGETLGGYLALIPSAVSVQAIAAAGADWVIIDQEHGAIGPESLHAMIAATAGTLCAPLVRVPRSTKPRSSWPSTSARRALVSAGRHGRGGGRMRRPHALPAARSPRLGAVHRARTLGGRACRLPAAPGRRDRLHADRRDPCRRREHRGDLPGRGYRLHGHRRVRPLDRARRLRPLRRARDARGRGSAGTGDPGGRYPTRRR